MTGWNLPPGCTVADIDRQAGVGATCDVCRKPAEWCICPECIVCEENGNARCYRDLKIIGEGADCRLDGDSGHGMRLNKAQLISIADAEIADAKERLTEAQMYRESLNNLEGDFLQDPD